MDTIGDRLRKTAGDVAERFGEAAHSARERLSEMNEIARINTQIRARKREKDRCRMAMADLLIRMFDQNTFAEALLRPEYIRIKEIDEDITRLEEERDRVTAPAGAPPPAAAEEQEEPEETVLLPEQPAAPPDQEDLPPYITAEE